MCSVLILFDFVIPFFFFVSMHNKIEKEENKTVIKLENNNKTKNITQFRNSAITGKAYNAYNLLEQH